MSKEKTGCFIAVEGADGVGKSTVLRLLLPQLLEDGKYSGFLFFHWKPVKANLNEGGIPETVAQDPRGSTPRNRVGSLFYLEQNRGQTLKGGGEGEKRWVWRGRCGRMGRNYGICSKKGT